MPHKQLRAKVLNSYDILDTPAAPEFDDIVHLACQSCEAPIGVVGFITPHRQWFKARIGISQPEIPHSQSISAIALDSGRELFVVPDMAREPLTKKNPLVVGSPGLRFYAGAVLRTPHGVALGTVSVLDTTPRLEGLHPDEAASLLGLARLTMILLELHRAVGLSISDSAVSH